MAIRLAIVGTQHPHSRMFQELLAAMPDIRVVAVYDDGGPVYAELAETPRFHTLDDLMADADFEAALLTVPNHQGVAAALALTDAGKHVLADKPVCRNAGEMEEIAGAVRRAGTTFAVAYQRRHHPVHRKAKRHIRGGELGDVFAVQAHLVTTDVLSRGAGHYLFEKEKSGGGVLHWLGCHMVDLIRDLTGADFIDVKGVTNRVGPAVIDVEDVAALAFRLDNGAVGSLTLGYAIPFDGDSPYRESPKSSRISVWGGAGALSYEPFGDRIEIDRYRTRPGKPAREIYDDFHLPLHPGYEGPLGRAVVEDFVRAVRTGCLPQAGVDDNLRALEVIDAAYR